MAVVSVVAVAWAQTPAGPRKVPIVDYKLKNGLRVILSPDHSAPVVAVNVTYNVGSRNERPGRPASPTCSNT